MILPIHSPAHLTYCLNIHPGETWDQNLNSIKKYATQVQNEISKGAPFGLGLRLSASAAENLQNKEKLEPFKEYLESRNMYVFTVNGFPYGPFHGTPVKAEVYQPDWRTVDRVTYTKQIANALSFLLPEDTSGSISTVPCSYKSWIQTEEDVTCMVHHLADCGLHLDQLHQEHGAQLSLGLEPEPDCYLETTNDIIRFFNDALLPQGIEYLSAQKGLSVTQAESIIRNRISICFDTCHIALQFEDLLHSLKTILSNDISISKFQISSALQTNVSSDTFATLNPFIDPVYLHQTHIKMPDGAIHSFKDLTGISEKALQSLQNGILRTHFHVPLYFKEYLNWQSTSSELTTPFLQAAVQSGCEHFEIETYTFDILPDDLKSMGAVRSIIREYEWISRKLLEL